MCKSSRENLLLWNTKICDVTAIKVKSIQTYCQLPIRTKDPHLNKNAKCFVCLLNTHFLFALLCYAVSISTRFRFQNVTKPKKFILEQFWILLSFCCFQIEFHTHTHTHSSWCLSNDYTILFASSPLFGTLMDSHSLKLKDNFLGQTNFRKTKETDTR